jgi:hypothetical protein
MAGKLVSLAGPLALTNTYTTNIYVPAGATLDAIIRHIHIANKTGGAVSFRLYIGATGANAAGTELFYDKSVAANDVFDYYCARRLTSTTFLVGGASAGTALSIDIEGELVAA